MNNIKIDRKRTGYEGVRWCSSRASNRASRVYCLVLGRFWINNDVDKNPNILRGVEIKCQLDATEVFNADLIACSTCFGHHYAHHQELKSIIKWLLPVVFGAVVFKLLVWCGAEGYVSGLQDARKMLSKQ